MSSLQPIRGTHDRLPSEMEIHNEIINCGRNLAEKYGFGEISTPIFETSQVFSRTLGDASDIVNKEMYSFQDRGGDELTLRPEGTAGIARAIISNGLGREVPLKYFYSGPMFRYERPQKGRTRQFHQIGVELVGVEKPLADVEVISLAVNFLKSLNIWQSSELCINSLGDPESRGLHRSKLVEYLKDHAAKLSADSQTRLKINPLRILDSKDKQDIEIVKEAPVLEEYLNQESKEKYERILSALKQMEIAYRKDTRLVRGLDYYNHCVFEIRALEGLGAQDTILAGGRYEGLINQMGGPNIPGVGWAAGLERLALVYKGKPSRKTKIHIIALGEEAELKAQSLMHSWRDFGLSVEMSYTGNLSKRMKKAQKAKAEYAVIIGDEELSNKTLQLKNFANGEQEIVHIEHFLQYKF